MAPAFMELTVKPCSSPSDNWLPPSPAGWLTSGPSVSQLKRGWVGGRQVLSAQAVVRTKRQEEIGEGALGSKYQTQCRLLLPVETQILTKALLFGGFSLRKFRVKIAQEGT